MTPTHIEWTEPEAVRTSKRDEHRAAQSAQVESIGWFMCRWTLWLGTPLFLLTAWYTRDPMSLLPPAACLLLISFVLPKGLALVAKTSTTSLTRWRIDEHGVSCVDRGARYAWSWGSIKGFSIGPHPAVETVAVVNVDFRGEGRQPMYFDPIEIDPAELMERFGSIGKPAEPFWKRIGLGRRRSDDGETPQLQENDGKR